MPTIPGMTVYPDSAIVFAPSGTVVEDAGPTAAILPPEMTTV